MTKGPVLIEKLFGALSELKSGKRVKNQKVDTHFFEIILHAQTENKEYNFTYINNLRYINNIFAVKKDLTWYISKHSEWDVHQEYSNLFCGEWKIIWCDVWIISDAHIGHKFKSFRDICTDKKAVINNLNDILNKNVSIILENRSTIKSKI